MSMLCWKKSTQEESNSMKDLDPKQDSNDNADQTNTDLLCQVENNNYDQTNTDLLCQVKQNNYDEVMRLIEENPNNVKDVGENGATALHVAAKVFWANPKKRKTNTQMISYLVKNDAKVKAWDKDNCTPLHIAAKRGNVFAVEAFVMATDSNIDFIDAKNNDGYTALHMAVDYGNYDITKFLLEKGADANAKLRGASLNGRTPLLTACYNEDTAHVEMLVGDPKVDIDAVDDSEDTPLHVAAKLGNVTIVDILLSKEEIQLDLKNKDARTPFLEATKNGYAEVCEKLIEKTKRECVTDINGNGQAGLHLAAIEGHLKVINLLLKKGADINAGDYEARKPLHYAAQHGQEHIVKTLLDNEADIHVCGCRGEYALHLACKHGDPRIVKLLLQNGADITCMDNEHKTALFRAVEGHKEDAATVIVQWENFDPGSYDDKEVNEMQCIFRNMIRTMPDVAKIVLDKYITTRGEPADKELSISLNFKLFDESLDEKKSGNGTSCITTESCTVRGVNDDHLLMLMVNYERVDLLTHPLVCSFIRRKWRTASYFLFTFLTFYSIFLGLLSAFVVSATPPYHEGVLHNMTECENGQLGNMKSEVVANYVIIGFASIGITVEFVQLIATKLSYLLTIVNYCDWFTYISSILIVIDLTECGIRTEWQWQLSVFCICIAWLGLILYLRRVPGFGIYVVMIEQICFTFAQFFFVFFLFTVAFSLSFHILLRNQNAFETFFFSVVKTLVMMVGEMDFTTIFYEQKNSDAHSDQVFYQKATYAIYIVFLFIMPIIVMNLLTGLAVGDVRELQEMACIKKLTMQVELVVEIERGLLLCIKRWIRSTNSSKKEIYPNKDVGLIREFKDFMIGGNLSRKSYVAKIKAKKRKEQKARTCTEYHGVPTEDN